MRIDPAALARRDGERQRALQMPGPQRREHLAVDAGSFEAGDDYKKPDEQDKAREAAREIAQTLQRDLTGN